ncbi:MAG TPA: hypothetical protein VHP33_32385 [Polyangiaceae bacterium]|nr:hypothetical protein [Polyangiaceae bacterium]
MSRLAFGIGATALLLGCNVSPAKVTGGVELPERGDCPRGLAVISTDFQSSEIALLAPNGDVESSAFISSASTAAGGLAAPFSGDLSVATARSRPGELVVIDRFGTNVLSFVDTQSGVVRAQLPIGTGFEANPQDYLELSEREAFVPRLGNNRSPGREPFDAGSDLLIIDPSQPAITGALEMPRRKGFLPNPVAVTQVGGDVLVTLQHARVDYSGMDESELVAVTIEDPKPRYRLPLSGLENCGRAELSPSRAVLAVACSAFVDRKGAVAELETSGLLLLDATTDPPQELRRFLATELVGEPLQSSIEFVTESVLLFKTQTALGSARDNQLFSLDLETGKSTLLASAARAQNGLGFGIAFGGMSCRAGCGDPCLVADLSRGKLLRFGVDSGELVPQADVEIDGAGLPPVAVTPFW